MQGPLENHRRWVALQLGVFLALGLSAVACGDLSNAPFEKPTPLARPAVTPPPANPSPVEHQTTHYAVSPSGDTLPDARYGLPFSVQFQATELGPGGIGAVGPAPADTCWRLAKGSLPTGLSLDVQTGLLSGRVMDPEPGVAELIVEAYSPCSAASSAASGRTQPLFIPRTGACQWDLDCAVGEACRQDGVCRAEIGGGCPTPLSPALKFELMTARGPAGAESPAKGGIIAVDGTVASHGFPSSTSVCARTDRELVVRDDAGIERRFCYHNPGELPLPVSTGDRVDLRVWYGELEQRAVLLTTRGQGRDSSSTTWAAYHGPLDATQAKALCDPKGVCPFLSGHTALVASGCGLRGACEPALVGLRLPGQAEPLWPGYQAPWGKDATGAPGYSILLAAAWSNERCGFARVSNGMTYLALEGTVPHPLLELSSRDVTLDSIPRWIHADGSRSVAAAQAGLDANYLTAYEWAIQPPEGHPEIDAPSTSSAAAVPAFLAGEYVVGLSVFDGKINKESRERASARVVARPSSALHVELLWHDPTIDLDLNILPPSAGGNWQSDSAPALREGQIPLWATSVGPQGQAASLYAEPNGATLEVLQLRAGSTESGAYQVAVQQSGSTDERSVTAELRVYAYGNRIDEGQFSAVEIEHNAIVPLVALDVAAGTLEPLAGQ